MKLTKYVFLQIVLLPIYVFTFLLVALKGLDPTQFLIGSITICGALSALSFTACANLRSFSIDTGIFEMSIAGLGFLRTTIYSLIALICYVFFVSISDQLDKDLPQIIEFGLLLAIFICYSYGMVIFHHALFSLLKAIEESFVLVNRKDK